MKIYTKTGDKGNTSLFGGKIVHKSDSRLEAYGTIDELNSHIGLLISFSADIDLRSELISIQNKLFTIGSNLANDPEKGIELKTIDDSDISLLENAIDRMDEKLEPLRNFILPGGSTAIAQAHVCRTVCRRAERRIVVIELNDENTERIIRYINRLSDYFFTVARYLAHIEQVDEVIWKS